MSNMLTHACISAGREASLSELLADVRRIKLAGDGLKAVRSRPATGDPQGRAAANSPSPELHTGAGLTVGEARQGERQGFQESPPSECSYSSYSSEDNIGSRLIRSGVQSPCSSTHSSSISMDQLPAVTRWGLHPYPDVGG